MSYIPSQGDIVWVSLDPQSGHEQKGRRPALIASNYQFNEKTGMAFVCPITSADNKFPLHVKLDKYKTKGFVMLEQLKSIDYAARNIEYIEIVSEDVVIEVLSRMNACF
ncbi:MAG: type II toxin-antitoxin system PemK/MazF family toxin [Clostridia bacterium]